MTEKILKEDFDDKIVLHKYADGSVATNVPHYWDRYHKSPQFNFNCNCPGALNLALNILIHCGYDRRAAFALHRPFADNYLMEAIAGHRIFRIPRIKEWCEHQIKQMKINLAEIEIF